MEGLTWPIIYGLLGITSCLCMRKPKTAGIGLMIAVIQTILLLSAVMLDEIFYWGGLLEAVSNSIGGLYFISRSVCGYIALACSILMVILEVVIIVIYEKERKKTESLASSEALL